MPRKSYRTKFRSTWLVNYGLEIAEENQETKEVLKIRCRFCELEQDDNWEITQSNPHQLLTTSSTALPRKRRKTTKCKYFQPPFRIDNIKRHMAEQHEVYFRQYQALDMEQKATFFQQQNHKLPTENSNFYTPFPSLVDELHDPNRQNMNTLNREPLNTNNVNVVTMHDITADAIVGSQDPSTTSSKRLDARIGKAEATARAIELEGVANIRKAELQARVERIAHEGRLLRLKEEQMAHDNRILRLKEEQELQVAHANQMAAIEITKQRNLMALEIDKFRQTIGTIARDTLVELARGGPEQHARVLETIKAINKVGIQTITLQEGVDQDFTAHISQEQLTNHEQVGNGATNPP